MISIYYNKGKGRNCLDSQLFGHFYDRVTQEKYLMTNYKILFRWNGFGRLTGKKFASDLLNLCNIDRKWRVSLLFLKVYLSQNARKRMFPKVIHKTYYFFNLVKLSPSKEDNIPINKGLKNPVMETFFDMTFANPVNSRLHHIKFSNSLDGCNC